MDVTLRNTQIDKYIYLIRYNERSEHCGQTDF